MNIAQIFDNLEKLVESFSKDSFVFDLLLAYGTPKATISRLQLTSESFALADTEQTIVIKKKLFFKSVVDEDLQTALNNLKGSEKVTKIFDKDLFTKSVDSHTQKDGSDLNVYLDTLFEQKIFHAEIVVDNAKVAAETKAYKMIPEIASFVDSDGNDNMKLTKTTIESNKKLLRLLWTRWSELETIRN